MTKCQARTAGGTGKKCRNNAINDSQYCSVHHRIYHDGEAEHNVLAEEFEQAANAIALEYANAENPHENTHEVHELHVHEEVMAEEPMQAPATVESDLELITKRIASMKLEVRRLEKVKKSFENSGKILTKAKWVFYHENKANPQLLEDVRGKLKSAGLYMTRPIKVNGQVVMKECIPYVIIKGYTDNAFNGMDDQRKAPYIAKARSILDKTLEIPSGQ